MQELLLIQGALSDKGLQRNAAKLAAAGNLRLRIVSIAQLEEAIPEDAIIAQRLLGETGNAKIILAPATVRLRSILPMLAWYLQAGLTADCTHLEISQTGELMQTRPAFGNSLIATIRTVSPVQMATVRPGTFPAETVGELPAVQELTNGCRESAIQWENTPLKAVGSIAQADILVAGGAGVGSMEGFAKLEAFAQKLGGAVGASRNAVDAGYAPYAAQVGLTGITVCPKVYIAVGISGAVQHLAGMSGAGIVIAINSDPKAPIFQYADYGIVGDWETILDEMMEELS